eukprot:3960953-Pleurochrysis_carterae.AAC.2
MRRGHVSTISRMLNDVVAAGRARRAKQKASAEYNGVCTLELGAVAIGYVCDPQRLLARAQDRRPTVICRC